jgi:hypothetical protein
MLIMYHFILLRILVWNEDTGQSYIRISDISRYSELTHTTNPRSFIIRVSELCVVRRMEF